MEQIAIEETLGVKISLYNRSGERLDSVSIKTKPDCKEPLPDAQKLVRLAVDLINTRRANTAD